MKDQQCKDTPCDGDHHNSIFRPGSPAQGGLFGELGNENKRENRNQNSQVNDPEPWLRLIRDRRWSTRQKRQLLQYFSTAGEIYNQSSAELHHATSGRWRSGSANISEVGLLADQQWLQGDHCYLISVNSEHYPAAFLQLPDPPIALFAQGNIRLLNDPAVAMVGSRHPTPAGRRMTEQISADLVRAGVSVVSGLALGIDGAAHQAALNANGATIAVMGCGLDIVYPRRHAALFAEIADRGCLISEYPLGMQVSRYTFPQRNRLVSGLCQGTVIVEAARRSGTLITARLAIEQNRVVMVVPGSPLSRQYAGSHALLQQGAALVTSAQDVLAELHTPLRTALENQPAPEQQDVIAAPENKLLDFIFHESTSVESIISGSGLTAAEVSSMLLSLEITGAITTAVDGGYVKILNEAKS